MSKLNVVVASLIVIGLMTGCGSNASLKFKTIEVTDVVMHPDASDEYRGMHYFVSFTYPAEYGNKAVLKTLQKHIIHETLGEKYASLSPREAVDAYIADRKTLFLEDEIAGRRVEVSGGEKRIANSLLITPDERLQLTVVSSEQWIGSRFWETEHTVIFDLETGEIIPDLYADLPDKDFPIPMLDGKIVPHDWMRPPEEHDVSTFYGYTGKDLMKSYQAQLREAGFLDQGTAGRVESLWIYERSEDGATLVVELGYNKEEKTTVIGMYVNYLHRDEEALIRPQKLNESDIPGEIGYQLDFVEGYRYTDKTGENIVFATEGGVMEWGEDDDGVTLSNKDLRAYRFLKVDGQWEEVWRVYDMVFECKNKPVAEFVREAFTITDLDGDGVAEIWLMYIKSCRGDVSPHNMFLRMYAGEEVYTLTGETRLVLSDDSVVGGEYVMDDNFLHNNTPPAFVDYAKSLWEKHIQGK